MHLTRSRPDLIMLCVAVLSLLFLAAPLIVIIPNAVSSGQYLVFPVPGLSFHWLHTFFADPQWSSATRTSLIVAAGAMLIATITGTLAAIALDGASFRGRGIVTAVIVAPLVVPVIMIGIAAYTFFVNTGLYGTLASISVTDSLLGVPYVFLTVSAALAQQDQRLMQAATSLGASPVRAFGEAVLPLIAPGILAGAILAFVASFDDIVIATFLASPTTTTLPLQMFQAAQNELDPTLAAASLFLIAVSLAVVALLGLMTSVETRRTTAEH